MTKLEEEIQKAITRAPSHYESMARAAGEVAKRYIVEYNTFIQANIGQIVPALKDHGAHAVFCDKLNDLRNKFFTENGIL